MPFMKNGKRDYKRDAKYESSPAQRKARSERSVARVRSNKSGATKKGDGKDLDHIKPLSKGGTNAKSNLRVVSAHDNRSFYRNSDSSVKVNRPRVEPAKPKKK